MDDQQAIDELSQALALCGDKSLIDDFLKSLLTEKEVHEVATRWALVKMIDQGVPQRKIGQQLGLSLCKITRGSKVLKKEDSSFKQLISLYENYLKKDSL